MCTTVARFEPVEGTVCDFANHNQVFCLNDDEHPSKKHAAQRTRISRFIQGSLPSVAQPSAEKQVLPADPLRLVNRQVHHLEVVF